MYSAAIQTVGHSSVCRNPELGSRLTINLNRSYSFILEFYSHSSYPTTEFRCLKDRRTLLKIRPAVVADFIQPLNLDIAASRSDTYMDWVYFLLMYQTSKDVAELALCAFTEGGISSSYRHYNGCDISAYQLFSS
jgi:hypothetical protein